MGLSQLLACSCLELIETSDLVPETPEMLTGMLTKGQPLGSWEKIYPDA